MRVALLLDLVMSELRFNLQSVATWPCDRAKAAVAAARACCWIASRSRGSESGGGCLWTVDVDLERRRRVPASLDARANI